MLPYFCGKLRPVGHHWWTIATVYYPTDTKIRHRLLHEDKKRGGTLYRLLKRYRKRKQRFGVRQYPSGPIIPNRTGIEHRPKVVESRSRLGDLEGDLIQGYLASGYVVSVVDRKSRFLVLRKTEPNENGWYGFNSSGRSGR